MVARDGRLLLRSDAAIVKKAVCSRFAAAYHVLELATDDRVRSNHHIAADVGAVQDDTHLPMCAGPRTYAQLTVAPAPM